MLFSTLSQVIFLCLVVLGSLVSFMRWFVKSWLGGCATLLCWYTILL